MNLLVLSNGAGEDAIAAAILEHLPQHTEVVVFPLIGAGSAYGSRWRRLGDGSAPPSQGLSNQSWRLWWRDLRHGLLGRVWRQWGLLRGYRGWAVLAVGDLVPCALAALAGLRPIYFVGTAKSVYHHAYSWPERLLLKKWVNRALVRDQPTADFLTMHGMRAGYLGNAMLDETVPSGLDLGFHKALALFPGSRSEAPRELPRQLRIWRRLQADFPCPAAVAVAPGMDLQSLVPEGYELRRTGLQRGVVGWLQGASCVPGGAYAPPPAPPTSVALVQGALGDLLAHSWVALGQAGTAHEQAAGAGVPVVTLHPDSQGKLGWYRGRQKGLLGEALLVVPEDEEVAARTLARLALDADERARRAAIGRERMGEPGGAARMAAWLANQL
ncbi:MAG: hypothetical protein KF760_12015 [Candidatus Eremiobacteraeota bacterium]|nr:hypothetical protein [Candidatus Eremiobacteraeota bacterium]